jgi:hypothetical protein
MRCAPVVAAPSVDPRRSAQARKLRPNQYLTICVVVVPQADWNIVKRGWDAHVLGKAPNKFTDAVTAVKTLRVRAWADICLLCGLDRVSYASMPQSVAQDCTVVWRIARASSKTWLAVGGTMFSQPADTLSVCP